MKKSIEALSPLTESTFYILLSVKEENHGYGIIKSVETLTEGRLKLAPGTLYGALLNLLKHKCIMITSIDESHKKKKQYVITDLGYELLKYEVKRISWILDHAKKWELILMIKRKLFFAWELKKEQAWLESLAKEGYVLEEVKFCKYIFKETEPVDLVYQSDFQVISKKNEQEYLDLFKDWTFVNRFGSWYYFYKERIPNEIVEIYNDNSSKVGMYRRLILVLVAVGFPFYYQLIIMFPNLDESEFIFPNLYFL